MTRKVVDIVSHVPGAVKAPQDHLPKRWLSKTEAAKHAKVDERTIRNYIARGDLKAYRPKGSRLIRIDVNDLDALMVEIPASDGAA